MSIRVPTAGKVAIEGNTAGEFQSGDLNVAINIADTTPIGDTWDSGTEVGRGWTFNGEHNYDPANTAHAALITAITTGDAAFTTVAFYGTNAGNVFKGSAKLTSATITKSRGEPDKIRYSFRGNGALTYTT